MTAEQVAADHYQQQQAFAQQAAAAAGSMWETVNPAAIAASWAALIVPLAAILGGVQAAAAAAAGDYLDALAEAFGLRPRRAGRPAPQAFVGASDGRDLAPLLYQPAIKALAVIGAGAEVDRALLAGRVDLDMIVRTQVADAGRTADGAALTAHREFTGYVRMLNPPSCARCIILAGRRYRWNDGFLRHPRCDCRHIPVAEDVPGDVRTDPKALFDSMSAAEQNRVFTVAGAQAIRDGADMAQVVNARRGAAGLTPAGARVTAEEAAQLRGGRQRGRLERTEVFGRQLFTTTEGTTVRGTAGVRLGARETGVKRPGQRVRSARAPRLMPESIYEIAGDDRDEALRLLRLHGYLT